MTRGKQRANSVMQVRLPLYFQDGPTHCVPACVRMVLAAFGDKRTEAELVALLGTDELLGTDANEAVAALQQSGYPLRARAKTS